MNDVTFSAAVVDSLTETTDKVQGLVKKAAEIDTEIKSGKYSPAGVTELRNRAYSIRREIDTAKEAGFTAARAIVNGYAAEIEKADRLDPAEITDDVKLLTAGVPLLKRDIIGMLERNADNRTMTQVILRYAKEHNIEVGAAYVDTSEHARNVENVNGIISIYERWIDKDNAYEMLKKMFS